jgi:hypothetical protein
MPLVDLPEESIAMPASAPVPHVFPVGPAISSFDLACLTSDDIRKLQAEDDSLSPLFQLAKKVLSGRYCYYTISKSGLLVRYVVEDKNSPNVANLCQVVAPSCIRGPLISLAHDMSKDHHQSINTTKAKIMQHYYWPNVNKDVATYTRICDICQAGANCHSARAINVSDTYLLDEVTTNSPRAVLEKKK